MRILSRYVFRQTAGALVLILVSLTGVVWIAVALRQLELMTTQGQDVAALPGHDHAGHPQHDGADRADRPADRRHPRPQPAQQRQRADRHDGRRHAGLVAAEAAGAAGACWCRSASPSSTTVAGPWAQRKLKELAVQVRTDLMAQVIQPWRFTSPEAKLTVHIRDRAPNGELLGLMMHDARDPKQVVTYLAERGLIIKQDGRGLSAHGQGPHRAPPGKRAGAADHRLRALCRGPEPARAARRPGHIAASRASATRRELLWPDPNDPDLQDQPRQLHLRAA